MRSTLIITISIPLAIISSVILLNALGETLNLMTLGGRRRWQVGAAGRRASQLRGAHLCADRRASEASDAALQGAQANFQRLRKPASFKKIVAPFDGVITTSASLRMPANVLLFRGDGLRVATVDGSNQVLLKPVALGRDYGAEVAVIDGLSADDNVILGPPDSIMEKSTVRIVKPDPGAKS